MTRHPLQTPLSVLLFRTILLTVVRTLWRPRLQGAAGALDRGPAFLYGNHSNRWDPFILNCFTPWLDPTGGVMTREFFRKPFLRWALSRLDIHPTRKRLAEPHLIRILHRMIDDGRKIVIYPEGGARWTGRPEPWIESTAKLFARMGIPAYPVITRGSYTSWPRWAQYPRPGRVEVDILEPLRFDRSIPLPEVIRRLKEPIAFDENVVDDRLRPRRAYRPADGIHRLLYRHPQTGEHDALFSPDGTLLTDRQGTFRMTVLPDSRLRDEDSGEIHLSADLYEQIRGMPLEPSGDGLFLTNGVELYTEERFPGLVHHGSVEASLHRDHIVLKGAVDRTLPLSGLRAADVERNFKLQLFFDGEMVQLSFVGRGSALAWRDALRRLREPSTGRD